jgi:hypothetical protein
MIVIAILAATFVVGALSGALVLLRLGMTRDKCGRWLPSAAQTRTAAATRIVTGLYVHRPEHAGQAEYVTAQLVPHRSQPTLATQGRFTHHPDSITPSGFENDQQRSSQGSR